MEHLNEKQQFDKFTNNSCYIREKLNTLRDLVIQYKNKIQIQKLLHFSIGNQTILQNLQRKKKKIKKTETIKKTKSKTQ